MDIGILSKRTKSLSGRIKQYYNDLGHEVRIYTSNDLCINDDLLKHDFFILKSKQLIYLYAGYFIKENNIPIYPDPYLTFKHKYRIDAHYLIQQAGLKSPEFYVSSVEMLKKNLKESDFPIVSKSLMDSGSKDVKIIRSIQDLNSVDNSVIYYEHEIKGTHYIIYFIGNEISVSEKPPLSNEHVKMKEITPTEEIKDIVKKWKRCHHISFGHLDVIKEDSTGQILVVDTGNFPEFTNWKQGDDPCPKICDIILNQVKYLNKNEIKKYEQKKGNN
ncbi:MAG: hypothetical protein ACFFBP_05095 [Promethearchaeota archaeon]